MILKSAKVQKHQNIIDSGNVEVDKNITCLVGKNESGKTAFLQALHKLNPHNNAKFKALDQYPRWQYKLDQRKGKVNSNPVISLTFELEENEKKTIQRVFGNDSLSSSLLTVSRYYNDTINYDLDINEIQVLKNKVLELDEKSELRKATSQKKNIESFREAWNDTWANINEPTSQENNLNELVQSGFSRKIEETIGEYLPTIFYFDEHSSLPGRIKLEDFLSKNANELKNEERTANSLLELAGTDRESIKTDEFEDRIAELEASASLITQKVLEYWTQNEHISVDFKVDKDIEKQRNIRAHYLDIRLRDLVHDVTINFDRRSSGFKWFFSFLVAFSEYEEKDESVIILLDEPGLKLHAKAQNDILRYINENLSTKHQVFYTTHSPFMVEPQNLHQVRLVEDTTTRTNKIGSKITSDIFSTNYDTIFPLQSALGYDLAQNLFVGKHNIVIEGTSDFTYLNIISRFLEENNRQHFDFTEITLTPVGGASKIATFVALLGQHLDAVVFMDTDKKHDQQISKMIERG